MTDLQVHATDWARSIGSELAILAEATGSVEGWVRAEAIIAAKQGRFGSVLDVHGEVQRDDLTLTTSAGRTRIELKVAWNNKNLFGGYNGTRGIAEDIAKLKNCAFDEKLIVAFFGFFDRGVHEDLGTAYHATTRKGQVRLQPGAGELFHPFAVNLAKEVVSAVCDAPEPVVEVFADDGRWFGAWIHRVG